MTSGRRKPFYSSITIIVLLPPLILFLNIVLVTYFGMKAVDGNRIDKVLHIFGAASICWSAAGVLWHLQDRQLIDVQNTHIFRALVFGFVCFVVVCWEILEYIVDIEPEYLTHSDTITDMIFGLVGGFVALCFVRRPSG